MITNVCMRVCVWWVNDLMKHIVAFRWEYIMTRWDDQWVKIESTNESLSGIWNDECHDCDGWRCDINDNDVWTISWFTTNKQVAVHIMTTFVRILAYSDATLFDILETVSLKILGRFFARIFHRIRTSSRVENYDGLEFSAKPFAKTIPLLESLRPIINVAKKKQSRFRCHSKNFILNFGQLISSMTAAIALNYIWLVSIRFKSFGLSSARRQSARKDNVFDYSTTFEFFPAAVPRRNTLYCTMWGE